MTPFHIPVIPTCEQLLVCRAIQLCIGRGAVVAGGYARDTFLKGNPKDIDVVMSWPGEVPRASTTSATSKEMEELAAWCERFGKTLQASARPALFVGTGLEGVSWVFNRVCPNYGTPEVGDGSFDDRIGCVLKMKLTVYHGDATFHKDVDILIPKNVKDAHDYVKEFDYNINQFTIEYEANHSLPFVSLIYWGGDDFLTSSKVREVGKYGTMRRALHLYRKYPGLDWSECTAQDSDIFAAYHSVDGALYDLLTKMEIAK